MTNTFFNTIEDLAKFISNNREFYIIHPAGEPAMPSLVLYTNQLPAEMLFSIQQKHGGIWYGEKRQHTIS